MSAAPRGDRRRAGARPVTPAPPSGPDPSRLAAAVARLYLESLAGRRSPEQLAPLFAPPVHERVCRAVRAVRFRNRDPWRTPEKGLDAVVVERVVTCYPSAGVCETSVMVRRAQRLLAISIRLERHRGVWRVVELASPEDGVAPLRTASIPSAEPDAFDEAAAEAGEPIAATA